MRTILFAVAAVAACTVLDLGAAQAQTYAYCTLNGPGPGNCRFNTYAQCLATASGTGYYCQPNFAQLPFYTGPGPDYGSDYLYGYGNGYGYSARASRAYGYAPRY